MIRVGGGTLEWSGVHLRLELPAEPADSWALFSLHGFDSLELQDAVLTICNANAQGLLLQDRVSWVDVGDAPRPEPSFRRTPRRRPSVPFHLTSDCPTAWPEGRPP